MLNRGVQPPVFRGADIHQIIKDLEVIERKSNLFDKSDIQKRAFFLDGNSVLVVSHPFNRIFNLKMWARFLLYNRSFDFIRPLAHSTTQSHMIRVKNNVIAFYPNHNMICKFWRSSGVRPLDNLHNEVKAIRMAVNQNFMKVPRVILDQSQTDSDHMPAIWLEYIRGVKPKQEDREQTAIAIMEKLHKWYEYHGISFATPNGLLPLILRDEVIVKDALVSFGWEDEYSEIISKAIIKILQCKKKLPMSYIHGDASVGNSMIDEDGDLVIIDWENAKENYIAYDSHKLINQGGHSVRQLHEAWLETIVFDRDDTLSLDIQLLLIYLCSNLNIDFKLNYFMNTTSLDTIEDRMNSIKNHVLQYSQRICGEL